mmetsp:Transcript_84081/g.175883  ORF Transcript_84081/g.175883 Transcript_84081/m.175883 type:complete len:91 (+) Transcript_84081:1-273(+)
MVQLAVLAPPLNIRDLTTRKLVRIGQALQAPVRPRQKTDATATRRPPNPTSEAPNHRAMRAKVEAPSASVRLCHPEHEVLSFVPEAFSDL